jgi:hypothetical protein
MMPTDNDLCGSVESSSVLEKWFGRYFGNVIFTNLFGAAFFVAIAMLG